MLMLQGAGSCVPLKTCTARRRPTTATFIRTPPGGRPGGTPGKPALPASAPDRPFRLPPAADDSAGAASSNSSDTTAEGPSTSGRLTSVSETRFALLSALFPVPPDTLGAMIAAEPKLRDLPITEVSAALMELRRRLPQCNLETIVCYAPKILFQDPDTVASALKKLRAFLPEPLLEFLVQEEQAILAGGLTPTRLNELREAWDAYGPAFKQYQGKDDELREELQSSRLAQYVRHTLVDFYH